MRTLWFTLALAPWLGLAVAAAPSAVVHEEGGHTLYGHRGFRADSDVQAAAFAPDGSWLLTVDESGALQKWSVPGGALLGTVPSPCDDDGYTGQGLAISPDGKRMAMACHYESLRVAQLATGKRVLSIAGDPDVVVWSDDGATLGAVFDDGVRLLDAETGKVLQRWPAEYDGGIANHGGVWAVVAPGLHEGGVDTGYGESWGVALVDSQGKQRWSAPVQGGSSVAFSVDGKHVVVGTGYQLKRLSAATGEQQVSRTFENGLYDLVERAGGLWGVGDERLYRLDARLEVESFQDLSAERLVSSRDGSRMAVLGFARTPVFEADGTALHSEAGLSSAPDATVVSADGHIVVSATSEGEAVVIDRTAGRVAAVRLGSWPDHLVLTADGAYAAAVADSNVHIIETATGARRRVRDTSDDGAGFLAFTPEGKLIVLSGWEQVELLVVDPKRAAVTSRRSLGAGTFVGAALSADGKTLVVPRHDGQLEVIPL